MPVKRRYSNKKEDSRRNNTVQYTVLKDSCKVDVCEIAFLHIHGLHKARGRIEILVKKICNGQVTPPLDKRGLYECRKNSWYEGE